MTSSAYNTHALEREIFEYSRFSTTDIVVTITFKAIQIVGISVLKHKIEKLSNVLGIDLW